MTMKCIYKCRFYGNCPTDDELITYDFELESDVVVSVEFIIECLDYFTSPVRQKKNLFQEEITKGFYDKVNLENRFGTYKVTTKCIHNNIEIVCVCE